MALFAIIKGYSQYKEIIVWMQYNAENELFKRLFQKEIINIPCKSTLHNILTNVDNEALEKIFRKYFGRYVEQKNIAIDGKWLRGSDINGQYVKEGHQAVLNVLDKDKKIVFAHKLLNKDKKSEIKAFKEILIDDTFSKNAQIFSFDAIMTQFKILNEINQQKKYYIAKLKNNQLHLKEKAIEIAKSYGEPTDRYVDDSKLCLTEQNKLVSREVEIFQNKDCDIVMHHEKFDNIQTIIKVTKTLIAEDGKKTITEQYLIANFKTTAEDFKEIILQHWLVETYHYHLDMLMKEDDHIAYRNPFAMSILRGFAINLYQLFLNENKDKKVLIGGKTTMAEIKRSCIHSDSFIADLLEQ